MSEYETWSHAHIRQTACSKGKRVVGLKIWGEIQRISEVYGNKKSAGRIGRAGEIASKKDVLSISSQAKDYQTVIRGLKDVPDIRQDKVNELSAKYDAGVYDVNGRDIADRIIRSVIDRKA